jgi:DNA-directed RNA polymerase beta' subunit
MKKSISSQQLLKCCPFCNSTPIISRINKLFQIACKEKSCEIRPKTKKMKSLENALFVWNLRFRHTVLGKNVKYSRHLHRYTAKK